MYMLEKEYASRLSIILASSYYRDWVNYFEKVLRVTRSKRHKNNKGMLLAFQTRLARIETQLWDILSEGREKAKVLNSKSQLSHKEKQDLIGTENHILIHEQLIRMSRTICDGIVWRNLGYNRTFLSSAARGFGAGRVDINSREFQSELEWAYRISKRLDSLVILNDLTHFLRVGDLTEINESGIFIHEIKKYGANVKNIFTLKKTKGKAKISQQAERLLELQRIAFTGSANVLGMKVGTRNIDLPLKTNIAEVKKLIRRSEKEFITLKNIEDCISIEVTNFNVISKNSETIDVEELKKLSPKDNSEDFLLTHSNWDSFYTDEKGNFLRAAPPYSVYPFSAKDCLNMMSGYYLIKYTLNITRLKDILKQHGWDIEERTEADLDEQIAAFKSEKEKMFTVKDSIYAHALDDKGLFTIRRGAFSMDINSMLYCRLTIEYLSLQSFLDILEEMYKIAAARKSNDAYFLRFKNEDDLWN